MPVVRRALHWLIVLNLGTGFLYAIWMVFVVFHVPGHTGPMLDGATEVPMDFFVRRRIYGLEAWLTFGFLSVYLALTELRPRNRHRKPDPSADPRHETSG